MSNNKKIKKVRTRNYLAKDFEAMRNDLFKYARVFYPDQIQDFNESSLGGLLMDMAAYVGDSMAFYLDHQFRELDPLEAVEVENIERHATNAGVKITGAAPAVATVDFYIKVPAVDRGDGVLVPDPSALPIILEGTVVSSRLGIKFALTEDLDFSKRDYFGELIAKKIKLKRIRTQEFFALVLPGICVSGVLETEKFSIPSNNVPFRTLTLGKPNVSEILSVTDTDGNEYYEVDSLSQDTVFTSFPNPTATESSVKSILGVVAAPYRFVSKTDLRSRSTRIQFGAGSSSTLNDDAVPDPSDLSLPLYGKKTMTRFSIDPNALLDTKTLGITPSSTTITVTYRHGGGASHNVTGESIVNVDSLAIRHKDNTNPVTAIQVRNSVEVLNPQPAAGGANQKTIEEIRTLIPAARNLQSRIVTKEDLISRLYLLPNQYGTIFRAGITENPNNPLGSILYIITKDASSKLAQAPDVLKKNISTYLNEFRLISDAIDILDAQVLNYRIDVSISVAPGANKFNVAKAVIDSLKKLLKIEKMQVGMPIIEADVITSIINNVGVLSLIELKFTALSGTIQSRVYSEESINMDAAKINGIFFPPPGGIFELRHPNHDIRVTVK